MTQTQHKLDQALLEIWDFMTDWKEGKADTKQTLYRIGSVMEENAELLEEETS